jgi:hypothetical protein
VKVQRLKNYINFSANLNFKAKCATEPIKGESLMNVFKKKCNLVTKKVLQLSNKTDIADVNVHELPGLHDWEKLCIDCYSEEQAYAKQHPSQQSTVFTVSFGKGKIGIIW